MLPLLLWMWQSLSVVLSNSEAYNGLVLSAAAVVYFGNAALDGMVTVYCAMQLSNSEASNGLVLPAVAVVYFGKAGAVLVVIICFMAVTSSGAGEGLACSSLFTFDVYRRYLKPKVKYLHFTWLPNQI